MNILTHALSGMIIAAPLFPDRPLTATCVVLGSVLPDVDVVMRVFGKVSFLRWHQTITHSIPIIMMLAAVGVLAGAHLQTPDRFAVVGIAGGMLLHSLIDATNTYGIAILFPFSRKRFCVEWVFFIDAVVSAVTISASALIVLEYLTTGEIAVRVSVLYMAFLVAYWMFKWQMRRRAWKLRPPGTRCLVPTALIPWIYNGYVLEKVAPENSPIAAGAANSLSPRERGGVRENTTFPPDGERGEFVEIAKPYQLNTLSGDVRFRAECEVLDREFASWVEAIPEYGMMQELSGAYHVTKVEKNEKGTTLTCRDLRVRSFGGKFGTLKVTFDDEGNVRKKVFLV